MISFKVGDRIQKISEECGTYVPLHSCGTVTGVDAKGYFTVSFDWEDHLEEYRDTDADCFVFESDDWIDELVVRL